METAISLLNFFLPSRCILCGKIIIVKTFIYPVCQTCELKQIKKRKIKCSKCSYPLISETELCLRCRDSEFSFLYNRSIFNYSGDIKELIYQYKFKNCKNLAYFFSKYLSDYLLNYFPGIVIIPVPGRKIVRKQKGWEHIDLISKILKNKYKLPVQKLLKRKGKKAQKTLSREKRAENIRKSISFCKKIKNIPKTVVLMDDIFTTGTTINECTDILKSAGVDNIYSITIAID